MLSTDNATTCFPEKDIFFYLVLLEKLIPERTEQASPPPCTPLEHSILDGPTPTLIINRHFFETLQTQLPLTSL